MPTRTLQNGTRRATAPATGSIHWFPVRRARDTIWVATMYLAIRPITYAPATTRKESRAVRADTGHPWRSQFIGARSYVFGCRSAMADDNERVNGDVEGER